MIMIQIMKMNHDQGMIGSEDLALAKHSILLITSGDLGTVFSQVLKLHPQHRLQKNCHRRQYLDHNNGKGVLVIS